MAAVDWYLATGWKWVLGAAIVLGALDRFFDWRLKREHGRED